MIVLSYLSIYIYTHLDIYILLLLLVYKNIIELSLHPYYKNLVKKMCLPLFLKLLIHWFYILGLVNDSYSNETQEYEWNWKHLLVSIIWINDKHPHSFTINKTDKTVENTKQSLCERFQIGNLSFIPSWIHPQIVRTGKRAIIYTNLEMGELCNIFGYVSKCTVVTYMGSKISLHFRWNDHLHCSRCITVQKVLQLIQHGSFIQEGLSLC